MKLLCKVDNVKNDSETLKIIYFFINICLIFIKYLWT